MNRSLRHLLTLALGVAILASRLQAQDFNEPAEIFQAIERSKLTYQVGFAEQQVGSFSLGADNVAHAYQVDADGMLGVAYYAFDSLTTQGLRRADAELAGGDPEAARRRYEEALKAYPAAAILWTCLGQALDLAGDPQAAAKAYEKAIALNFHGYMAHWMLAENLFRAKQTDKAAREIALAWVLNRNHAQVKTMLIAILKADKRRIDDFEFIPDYSLRKADGVVQVTVAKPWLLYALCKALWAYEPGYHQEMGGARGEFDMDQEKECLLNLAIATQNTEKGKSKEPAIRGLLRAMEGRRINAFIFVEEWLRMEPMIVFSQPREAVETMADYVLETRFPKR